MSDRAEPVRGWSRGLGLWLASRLLPESHREFVLGDLEELHGVWVARDGRAVALWRFAKALLLSSVSLRFGGGHEPADGDPLRRGSGAGSTGLVQDVVSAGRGLWRRPRFTAVVTATLGIGIGSTCAVFGMVNQLILRPLPGVADPDRAAFLQFHAEDRPERLAGLSGPDVMALRDGATMLAGLATYGNVGVQARLGDSNPVDVTSLAIQGDYFEVLGVRPALGRLTTAEENGVGADPGRVVISERFWRTWLGGRPDIVGQTIRANGHDFTVIGVAGGGFAGTDREMAVDAWFPKTAVIPLAHFTEELLWSRDNIGASSFVIRPREGVALDAARRQIDDVIARLAADEPTHGEYLGTLRAGIFPGLHTPPYLRELTYRVLGVLTAAVAMVLLIACANVANLLLVRGLRARSETAVRRALGASRWRVARFGAIESLWLGGLGALAGLAVAWLIGFAFRGEQLGRLPALEGFHVEPRLLGFACLVAVVTGLVFGVVPTLFAGRFDLVPALKTATTRATPADSAVRYWMSVAQIALSLTLLVAGLLLIRTVGNLYRVPSGLDIEDVQMLSLALGTDHEDGVALDPFYHAMLAAVEGVTGPGNAALTENPPYWSRFFARMWLPEQPDAEPVRAEANWVTPGWFDLLGVEPVVGRTFTSDDWGAAPSHDVVVTAPLAVALFGTVDVVGRTIMTRVTRQPEEVRVIGVVGDLRAHDLGGPPDETMFLAFPHPLGMNLSVLVRVAGSDPTLGAAVQSAVERVAADVPVPLRMELSDRVDEQLAEQRLMARLLGLLSGFSVVLAAVGLYGVVSFAVATRWREFGIRVALGADRARIARMVLGSAFAIVVVGITLGLVGAYVLAQAIESRLFGLAAFDPTSFVTATLALAGVAFVACMGPARAAMASNPIDTLKSE